MIIQAIPVSRTTRSWSTNLGSLELIAVKVTMVLIPSRAMIFLSGPGRCHAPRTRRPADTTLTRFSSQSSRKIPAYASKPTLAPKHNPAISLKPRGATHVRGSLSQERHAEPCCWSTSARIIAIPPFFIGWVQRTASKALPRGGFCALLTHPAERQKPGSRTMPMKRAEF